MDPATIMTLLGGAQASIQMLLTAKEIKENFEYNQAVLEIQTQLMAVTSELLALQQNHAATIAENDELRQKVKEMVEWADKVANYRLKDFGSGTFAYVQKNVEDSEDDQHYLCPNCYLERKPSILQFKLENNREQKVFHCHKCNSDFPLGNRHAGDPQVGSTGGFNPHDFA